VPESSRRDRGDAAQACADAERIGLETGPLTTWLWPDLTGRGLPMVCLDARQAKKVLDIRINKTNSILAHVESGHGVLGKLVYDDKYANVMLVAKKMPAVAQVVLVRKFPAPRPPNTCCAPAPLKAPRPPLLPG